MRLYSLAEFVEEYCRATGRWAVTLGLPTLADGPDAYKLAAGVMCAAPVLATEQAGVQCMVDGYGVIVCETEAEAEREFRRVVGKDGPTELNPYSGPVGVYAAVCGPEGFTDENT